VVQGVRKVKSLEKALADFVYNDARLRLSENARLGLVSRPGEDAVEFRERCLAAARRQAESEVAVEKEKYRPKFAALGVPMPVLPEKEADTGLLDLVNPLSWFGWTGKKKPAVGGDKAARLEAEWLAKQGAILDKWQRLADEIGDVPLKPRRDDVQVTRLALAWAPHWQVDTGPGRVELFPAYR
jgi:hypothetical protein